MHKFDLVPLHIMIAIIILLTIVACGTIPNAEGVPASAIAQITSQQAKIANLQAALDAAQLKVGAGSVDVKSAQALVDTAKASLTVSQENYKVAVQQLASTKVNEAAKWRDVGIWIGAIIDAFGLAIGIFCMIEGWPLKWLAVILGSVGTGLAILGYMYWLVYAHFGSIIVALVGVACAAAWYCIHTHASLLSVLSSSAQVAKADLTMAGAKAAKRWGVGIIDDIKKV